MAGCDGWITIKIFELLLATFCMIYKRVTDDEANKLFYYLQKYSREWPLLNSVTWEENGGIFADITYGSYIIIIIGLIVGQATGEFRHYKKLENFFLVVGALLFLAAGSLELAALESVEERLVDNAAILGVFSLVTGFLFIIDLLSASKRRKREKIKFVKKGFQSKLTQTEDKDSSRTNGDINGNLQVGAFGEPGGGHRIPKNAVKILPSSPVLSEYFRTTGKHPSSEYLGRTEFYIEPPIVDENDLKTHEGRIRSTESFLRSEKGLYPKVGKNLEADNRSNNHFFIPNGFVLVPADHFQTESLAKSDSGMEESFTPPGYSKVNLGAKGKSKKDAEEIHPRKFQSSSAGMVSKSPLKTYYINGRETRIHSPKLRGNDQKSNFNDGRDIKESGQKKHSKYSESDGKGQKHILQSEDSSDEQKEGSRSEEYSRPGSRFSERSKEWKHRGKMGEGYVGARDSFSFSRRLYSHQSPAAGSPTGKPHGILRFDAGRSSKKEREIHFPKDVQYDSLDGKKIAEDLRTLKEITKSEVDSEYNQKKRQPRFEESPSLSEVAEEQNRRISEKEEQYFGLKDLKQSHGERKFEIGSNRKNVRDSLGNSLRIGSKQKEKISMEIDERPEKKYMEEKETEEVQEFRDLIDERFYFLNEEEKKKDEKVWNRIPAEETSGKLIPRPKDYSEPSRKNFERRRSDSDESRSYTQSTNEEIFHQTPGNGSYKSEAVVWVKNHGESPSPITPASPGYVLYTAQNWPESPSPQDRFQFNSKEAQQLSMGMPSKNPLLERTKSEEVRNSNGSRGSVDFEESSDFLKKSMAGQKGLLVKKVEFPIKSNAEIERPSAIVGSTSTWKKWLRSKPKLVPTQSAPN